MTQSNQPPANPERFTGTGKTKTGRLWAYLRDERPYGGTGPPANGEEYEMLHRSTSAPDGHPPDTVALAAAAS